MSFLLLSRWKRLISLSDVVDFLKRESGSGSGQSAPCVFFVQAWALVGVK